MTADTIYVYTYENQAAKKNYWGSQKSWESIYNMAYGDCSSSCCFWPPGFIHDISNKRTTFWLLEIFRGLMERGGLPCIIGSCRRCRVINRQRERGECIDIKHTLMFHVCIHCADICIEGNWLAGWRAIQLVFLFYIKCWPHGCFHSLWRSTWHCLLLLLRLCCCCLGRRAVDYGQLSRGQKRKPVVIQNWWRYVWNIRKKKTDWPLKHPPALLMTSLTKSKQSEKNIRETIDVI